MNRMKDERTNTVDDNRKKTNGIAGSRPYGCLRSVRGCFPGGRFPTLLFAVCLAVVFPHAAAHPADRSAGPGSLISPNVWALMRNAEFAFDEGDVGDALVLGEKARELHRSEIESMSAEVKRAVSSREVKAAGDNISAVYQTLTARGDSAVEVLDEVLSKYAPDAFSHSVSALLSWLDAAAAFPEADIFTGRIYEAEGEYRQAFSFYEKAWEKRAFLDVPGDGVRLAYHMADLAGRSGNPGARENYLLLALADDPVFGTPGRESPALLAMIRTAKEDVTGGRGAFSGVPGSDSAVSPAFVKFFSLYRNDNPSGLKAYQDLTDFYYVDSGKRLDRAMATGVLSAATAFTLLENAVRNNEFDYTYASFSDTIRAASRHPEITEWAFRMRIWDSFLQFASVLYDSGARDFAAALWMNLSLFCPDDTVVAKASASMDLAFRP